MTRRPESIADLTDRDCADRTVLVTGSTAGIGREIALAFARLGATILVHGRNEAAGEAVVAQIEESIGSEAAFFQADFSRLSAVDDLADAVRASHAVDVLVNNAGAVFRSGGLTADGFERTIAVNHLAPFRLTCRLLPDVREAEDGRVVTTASAAHRSGSIDVDSFESVDGYSAWSAYCGSKLANVLFTRELARREPGITAASFHPGYVPGSRLYRNLPIPLRASIRLTGILPLVGSSLARGAATGLQCCLDESVRTESGAYFAGLDRTRPSEAAMDDDLAAALWRASVELTGAEEMGSEERREGSSRR